MAFGFLFVSLLISFSFILNTQVGSKPAFWRQKRNTQSQTALCRCGNDNFDSTTLTSTAYQYLPDKFAPRLSARCLSWKITQYPVEIDNHTTVERINLAAKQALNLWSSVTNLRFHHSQSGSPDVEIKFLVPKAHKRQCSGLFTTNTIAHYVAGSVNPREIHFNEQFEWTTTRLDTRNDSINLVTLIAHEVGHLLGFGHTIAPNSIMNPFYPSHVFTAPVVLSSVDIAAATNRYGTKVHPHRTVTVSSNYSCSQAFSTFVHNGEFSVTACSTLYGLDNCRGNSITLPRTSHDRVDQPYFGNWGISSMQIAPNCYAKVCSSASAMEICSDTLRGTIPKFDLDCRFGDRIDRVSCSCGGCESVFPIREPNKTICAAAYSGSYCGGAANVFSSGSVWLRNSTEYWRGVNFHSAEVNPNCTANFCQTEAITNQTCRTLSGGDRGQTYLDLRLENTFLRDGTSVHCRCVS